MIKKFSLILITLCMIKGTLFAADSSVSGDSLYAEDKLRKTPHYATSLDLNVKCRRLKDEKLKTQIVDFDIEKGITYCQIYKKDNPDFILNINADAQWQVIKDAKLNEYEKDKITTKIESMSSSIGKNTGNSSSGDTLSTFLVKTVLLMDNSGGSKGTVVTEYDASDLTQTWNNSSGFKETATNMLSSLWENIKTPFKYIGSKVGIDTEIATKELKVPYVASASDGFDAYNIAYYRALFNGMNSVYIHLQNLLFVVVGGFFLATLGGGKIQKYLENRGQSTGNKEPYLHKFFIPLLCAGVFYMPITSGGGVNSTMIQKIIQYFSIEANNIADKASSIGANIYINKVYASTKINNSDDVVAGYEAKVEEQKNINAIAKKYMTYCQTRWGELKNAGKNAQSLDEVLALANFEELTARASEDQLDRINELKKELNRLQQWDTHSGMNNIEQDITIQACAKAKKARDESAERHKEYEEKLKEAKQIKASSNVSDKVKEGIDAVDERLRMRDEQLGWFNSILTPSSALILELQKSLANYNPKDKQYEKFENYNDQLNLKSSKKVNNQAVLGLDSATELLQQITYLILPGAGSLYNALSNTSGGTRDLLCAAQAADKGSSLLGFVWDGFVCKAAAQNDVVFGVFYTSYLYEKMLSYLPVLVTSVAAILACVGYLITLCKYFYISPFVVAFALTTKRVDKIINFLVTGVTIFFKPVLIVLFIYLALFLYSFISDIFVFAGLSQFNILPRSLTDITSVLTFGIIKAFLLALGTVGSCYVIWKTIMSGPDWTFKLLGLDKDSDNTIVQGLGSKLEARTTMV